MFGGTFISAETQRMMRLAMSWLAEDDDDPGYAECVEHLLPQLTLIGPDAGAELRAMVYGV